jgi:hypothetical protein
MMNNTAIIKKVNIINPTSNTSLWLRIKITSNAKITTNNARDLLVAIIFQPFRGEVSP